MSLNEKFLEQGFELIAGEHYLAGESEKLSLPLLKTYYQKELRDDGPRRRAYLKLEWERASNQIKIAENQCYFQTAASNNVDGGMARQFHVMDKAILDLPLMQRMLNENKAIVADFEPLRHYERLVFGLHFIQYHANQFEASYSSPVGLHIDDEPLVFVHLIELSKEALGGDNLIARLDDQQITHVIRLENPMETMVLNNNCYHAVTPLGSREARSVRDIILFTVEPEATQLTAAA